MGLDLLFKIVLLIVVIGISIKVIKTITGMVFKLALILLVILFIYKIFIGF